MTVIEWVGKSPSGSAGEFWSRSESMIISWSRGSERGWRNRGSVWKRVGMKEVCSTENST
jgi:hypothetical protein